MRDPEIVEAPEHPARATWPWVGEALAIFLASRAAVVMALYSLRPVLPRLSYGRALSSWDGQWYEMLARDGYPRTIATVHGKATLSTIAFFPSYPGLMRALSSATGISLAHAGITISTLCAAAFVVLLWFLVEELFDVDVARRTIALVCFFPGSLFLSMVYSEAMMLALVVGGLILLARERWVLAGLVGAVATATRPNALAFSVAALAVAIVAARRPGPARWKPFLAPALSVCGFVGVLGFLGIRTGQADAWFRVEHDGWGDYFAPQRRFDELTYFVRHPFHQHYNTIVVIGLVFVAFALWCLWRARLDVALTTYTLSSLALALGSYALGARPRFILAAFPLLIAVAIRLRGTAFVVTVALFASALVGYTAIVTPGHYATP